MMTIAQFWSSASTVAWAVALLLLFLAVRWLTTTVMSAVCKQ